MIMEEQHKCTAREKGDWIIYECPLCKDYKRAFNRKTGKMKSRGTRDNPYLHNGMWTKVGLDVPFNLN